MFTRDQANAYRYDGTERGHYESYFLRANHPTRSLAFWIRYTVFVPRARRDDAIGELWAIFFDGETGGASAVKEVVPLNACRFAERGLDVHVGDAVLDAQRLQGAARTGTQRIAWSLSYHSSERPVLLLPERLYGGPFPKAKALVAAPLATFQGTLEVDGRSIDVDGWVGSQNHNWGSKHTDAYAWGQVAGFDNAPDAFFECATARVKIGPLLTPQLSPMVLRFEGEEYCLNSLLQSWRAKADRHDFHWTLESRSPLVRLQAKIHARAHDFVALRYGNPPGGSKVCLNTKLAACELTVQRKGRDVVVLKTERRAAFEILTDGEQHGVAASGDFGDAMHAL